MTRRSKSAARRPGAHRWTWPVVALLAVLLLPAAAHAADPVIAVAGDIACDPKNHNFNSGNGSSDNCRQKHVSDLLLDSSGAPTVNAVLPTGDNQYYCGGPGSWSLSYALSWGRMPIRAITYPVPGNHEYVTDGGSSPTEATNCNSSNQGAAGYYQYFGTNFGTSGDASRGYYSYDIGTWHLIGLNSGCSGAGGCSATSPQGAWLRADLAAHQNMCTLAYWHVPLYSSGGRASSTYKTFWDALYAADADLVIGSHDHLYERFAPQTPTGAKDTARGIRQFVVGTGGANHTGFKATMANSEKRNSTVYGVLKLTLHPTSYDYEFVPETRDRMVFSDSGSGGCHGATPDNTAPTAPAGLNASAVGSQRVDLSWSPSTDNVGVTEYRIFRNGSGTPVGSTSGTTFSDTNVAPSTTYSYVVRAYDQPGNASDPSNTATATTAAGNATLTFTPAADSWIQEDVPNTNFGSDTNLQIDSSPVQQNTLLRFVVNGIGSGTVVGAKLRLAVTNSSSGSTTARAFRTVTNSWTETGVTWANAPAADASQVLGTLGPVSAGTTYDMNLAAGTIGGDGSYSLRLTSASSDGTQYSSRETTAKPQLLVTVAG